MALQFALPALGSLMTKLGIGAKAAGTAATGIKGAGLVGGAAGKSSALASGARFAGDAAFKEGLGKLLFGEMGRG